MQIDFIQNYEYHLNTNFRNFCPSSPSFNDYYNLRIDDLIIQIDNVINFVSQNKRSTAKKEFNDLTKTLFQELTNVITEASANDREFREILLKVIEHAKGLMAEYVELASNNPTFESQLSRSKNIDSKFTFLKENGYCEFTILTDNTFQEYCQRQLEFYRNKYKDSDDWRGGHAMDPNSKDYKLIDTFIRKEKIVELISEYKKMDMEIIYFAEDYCHSRQKWYRHNHDYNHISATNYYHFDADSNVSKMLIYLTDVSKNDGPFKFVKGSNVLNRSTFLTYIYSTLDTTLSPLYSKEFNLYGRGLYLYNKELLMKFPKSFQGSTHFGDDLIETSFLSKYLIDNTVSFEKEKGACVLFDGFRGIHAGGNPINGERLAIQVAFKRKETPKSKWGIFNR